ncbi:unnamed protein product [Larinioides sclopetarius]|uniref:Secreted protein n=1 Tax=Larinioides sclopetarius TaxID=280406 RepID=A0AAV2BC18_9ARAC
MLCIFFYCIANSFFPLLASSLLKIINVYFLYSINIAPVGSTRSTTTFYYSFYLDLLFPVHLCRLLTRWVFGGRVSC